MKQHRNGSCLLNADINLDYYLSGHRFRDNPKGQHDEFGKPGSSEHSGANTFEFQYSCRSQEHKFVDGGGKSEKGSAATSDEIVNTNYHTIAIYLEFIPCHL